MSPVKMFKKYYQYEIFRLNQIERFGTGVKRINEAYTDSETKPVFEVMNNTISVILPVVEKATPLNKDEKQFPLFLKNNISISSSEIAEGCGFGKTKTVKVLNSLVKNGYIITAGTGRGLKYVCD